MGIGFVVVVVVVVVGGRSSTGFHFIPAKKIYVTRETKARDYYSLSAINMSCTCMGLKMLMQLLHFKSVSLQCGSMRTLTTPDL
jgi:hypothetical protein